MSQRDVKNRISSIQNIRKITSAMEMVAAARLRRAELRIAALRPYADSIRRMTRQAADAAGVGEINQLPLLQVHEGEERVALLLITADRGLAGAFNSQILRAGLRAQAEIEDAGQQAVFFATGRRGVSSLTFRNREPEDAWTGFTERPVFADAREVAQALMAAYVDGKIDRVEIFYNGYISPLTQEVRRQVVLPVQEASVLPAPTEDDTVIEEDTAPQSALVDYEPDPLTILKQLIPDYVELMIYRALLESSASELGARMTAMRSASENAGELIEKYTLEMNRARQAEITQEIMEVVGGAEALS